MHDEKKPVEGDVRLQREHREQLELATKRGREIHKLRGSTAETVNSDLRCFRGLDRFLVRGLPKATCVVLWSVLACDLMRLFRLTT